MSSFFMQPFLVGVVVLYFFIRSTTGEQTYRSDQVSELTSKEGHWGSWFGPAYCNAGQWVIGFKFKSESDQGSFSDDTAGNNIKTLCALPNESTVQESIVISHGKDWGSWDSSHKCNQGSHVTGFRTEVENDQGNKDDTALNCIEVMCSDGNTQRPSNCRHWGNAGAWAYCPANAYVCGHRILFEKKSDGIDDETGLNAVRFYCCAFTAAPSDSPSDQPSSAPSSTPTSVPTRVPSSVPTRAPSSVPTRTPSEFPSMEPTYHPSSPPTLEPTFMPTKAPTFSFAPTVLPTGVPSLMPTVLPPTPTSVPTSDPILSTVIVEQSTTTEETDVDVVIDDGDTEANTDTDTDDDNSDGHPVFSNGEPSSSSGKNSGAVTTVYLVLIAVLATMILCVLIGCLFLFLYKHYYKTDANKKVVVYHVNRDATGIHLQTTDRDDDNIADARSSVASVASVASSHSRKQNVIAMVDMQNQQNFNRNPGMSGELDLLSVTVSNSNHNRNDNFDDDNRLNSIGSSIYTLKPVLPAVAVAVAADPNAALPAYMSLLNTDVCNEAMYDEGVSTTAHVDGHNVVNSKLLDNMSYASVMMDRGVLAGKGNENTHNNSEELESEEEMEMAANQNDNDAIDAAAMIRTSKGIAIAIESGSEDDSMRRSNGSNGNHSHYLFQNGNQNAIANGNVNANDNTIAMDEIEERMLAPRGQTDAALKMLIAQESSDENDGSF